MKCNKFDMIKYLIIGVVALVFIDQTIKIIISNGYMNTYFVIWKDILTFEPIQNIDQSWLGSLGVPGYDNRIFIIILRIITLGLSIRIYSYFINILDIKIKLMNITFTFFFAGAICSLIDSIFWNGSIDYITLFDWFTFDLKDCYVNFIFVLLIVNYKLVMNISISDIKKLGKYCLMIKNNINNN